ncbi:MAG TPA: hypothetical protein PKE00_12305, partial [Planctomycetota bacterium]|nr:hypothetical protein [Planctomycetota bacterium]
MFDESGRHRRDARIWFGGRDYRANSDGEIGLPYSTKPGRSRIILRDGDFACASSFDHKAETYTLHAGIHVDRESLVAGKVARVLVRPSLLVGDAHAALQLLEDSELVIEATHQEGTTTQAVVDVYSATMASDFVHTMRVPERLKRLRMHMRARVRSMSRDAWTELKSSPVDFDVNWIDQTDRTWAPLLGSRAGENGAVLYHSDVLGKTGEAKQGLRLGLVLRHRDYVDPIPVTLETDERGRVELGTLEGIQEIQCSDELATAPSPWYLHRDRHRYPSRLHGHADQTLRLPFSAPERRPTRDRLSFFELRAGKYAFDSFDSLRVDGGYLELVGLRAGSYLLHLKHEGVKIDVEVVSGERSGRFVVGGKRVLEMSDATPLQIVKADLAAASLRVVLGGATPST